MKGRCCKFSGGRALKDQKTRSWELRHIWFCKQEKSHAFVITIAPRCHHMRGDGKNQLPPRDFSEATTPVKAARRDWFEKIVYQITSLMAAQICCCCRRSHRQQWISSKWRAAEISTLAVCVVAPREISYLGYRSNGRVEILFLDQGFSKPIYQIDGHTCW
jgi:hypothetical protein